MMTQRDRVGENKVVKWASDLVYGIAITENGAVMLGLFMLAPLLALILLPTILVLSYLVFSWLRFRLIEDRPASLLTAGAAIVWPLTTWLLFGGQSVDVAWLFGPVFPYAMLVATGLAYRHTPPPR
jgi:hypothetical protein